MAVSYAGGQALCPIALRQVPGSRYSDPVKSRTGLPKTPRDLKPGSTRASAVRESSHRDAEVGLERIIDFEEQLAHTPVNSRRRRELTEAMRIETDAYRKSLDTEQVRASHDLHAPATRPAVSRSRHGHRRTP
jgi:hypothetical protein